MSAKKQQTKQSAQEVDDEIENIEMDSEHEEHNIKIRRPQLQIQRDENDNSNATYSFLNEDHTLGNLLRNVLIKNNKVDFCAYSVPHPSEPIMNVRLQVNKESGDTKKVLKHGLKRISKMCDIITQKFNNALVEYENKMSD